MSNRPEFFRRLHSQNRGCGTKLALLVTCACILYWIIRVLFGMKVF